MRGRSGPAPWVVPEALVENARYVLGPDGRALGIDVALFASHWTDPLLEPQTGLRARLGLNSGTSVGAADLREPTVEQLLEFVHNQAPEGSSGMVAVGGAGLLRAAVKRSELASRIEVARLGRIGPEQLQGHLQRVQGIELTGPQALERVMVATGGIPLLVGKLDSLLVEHHGVGATVDAAALDAALQRLTEALPDLGRALADGQKRVRLEPRELELLRLAGECSRSQGVQCRADMIEALQWPELLDQPEPGPDVSGVGPEDDSALEVLLTLGLLPRAADAPAGPALDQVDVLRPDDALYALLEHA